MNKPKSNTIKRIKPLHTAYSPNYNMAKPLLYKRVDEEKQRMKIGKMIQNNNEYLLKKKYFDLLKFYHNVIQLRKRIKLSYKLSAYLVIRNYYYIKTKKYEYIINHFNNKNKRKVFMMLLSQYITEHNKNIIIRLSLVKAIKHFINITTKQLLIKNNIFYSTEKFYYYKFINNTAKLKATNNKLISSFITAFHAKRKQLYFRFIHFLKTKTFLKHNITNFKTTFTSLTFFSNVKALCEAKRNNIAKAQHFHLKQAFISFYNQLHYKTKYIKLNRSAVEFYVKDLIFKKVFFYLHKHNYYVKKFREICKKKYTSYINHVKDAIRNEKEQIGKLGLIGKVYRKEKEKQYKQFLFDFLLHKINSRKMNYKAYVYHIRNIKWKFFKGLSMFFLKSRDYKIFVHNFKTMYNHSLIRHYLSLMLYHKSKKQKSSLLPMSYTEYQNIQDKLYKLCHFQMHLFYRKCIKLIKSKQNNNENLSLAIDYFITKRKEQILKAFKSTNTKLYS